MNKLLQIFVFALFLYLVNGALAFDPAYDAIAQVRAPEGQGSGTLIATRDDGTALVLSCRHVCGRIGNRVQLNWILSGGQTSSGVVWDVVPGAGFDTDLALVICDRPSGVLPRRVVPFQPQNGQWVSAGFRGGQLRYSVSSAARLQGSLLTLNSPFVGGMSGGPTFDRFGRVVGVVVASDRRSYGVSTDGDLLHNLIRKYRSKK